MRLSQSNRAASGDKWEERISRRLQRITDALNKEISSGLEYGRLHKTLSSLENEMLSRKDTGMTWHKYTVTLLFLCKSLYKVKVRSVGRRGAHSNVLGREPVGG